MNIYLVVIHCYYSREHAAKLKKKEMISLTNEEKKHIVGKKYVIYAKQALGGQWNGMVSCNSHKCCTVRGR